MDLNFSQRHEFPMIVLRITKRIKLYDEIKMHFYYVFFRFGDYILYSHHGLQNFGTAMMSPTRDGGAASRLVSPLLRSCKHPPTSTAIWYTSSTRRGGYLSASYITDKPCCSSRRAGGVRGTPWIWKDRGITTSAPLFYKHAAAGSGLRRCIITRTNKKEKIMPSARSTAATSPERRPARRPACLGGLSLSRQDGRWSTGVLPHACWSGQ
jgi:hypothetical protein